MRKKVTFLLIFLLACSMFSFAQDHTVNGVVKDKQGVPIPGVSVKIKGTNKGVSTGVNGDYRISVTSNSILVFTSIGFAIQEQKIGSRTEINVTLADDTKQLDEVVVIGYGTAAKKDVTGSISSIRASKLENENPNSVTDILKGNIPGLSVSMNTSPKGGDSKDFLVRGKTTLSATTFPLIVLDGVIYPGQISDINPNDIESVDVLKDASSLAVYGAKAATGVVAITTKKGRGDKTTITINSNIGTASLARNQKVYDGPGFLNWRADVMRSGSTSPAYLYNNPNDLPEGVTMDQWMSGKTGDPIDVWLDRLGLVGNEKANYKAGKTFDWYDKIFRTGLRQDHTLSLSGRKEEVSYYMSLGYLDNENLIEGGEFNTVRARLNLEAKAAKFLTVGINSQFAARDESAIEADWGQLTNLSPYGDFYNADGSLRRIPTDDNGLNARNPFLDNYYNNNLKKFYTLFTSLFAKVDLPFGITFQSNFSPDIESYRTFSFKSSKNPNVTNGGSVTRDNETRYNWQIDNLLKWNKTFHSIHTIDVTLLQNGEKYQSWWTDAVNEGFVPNDDLGYHGISTGIKPGVSSDDRIYTAAAYMGRLNYTLLRKYMFTASIRRDGYSAFGQKYPWATFPALALGWVFTEEPFMKSLSWLNYGKLRLSWGINGNRDLRDDNGTVNPYAALPYLNSEKYQTVNNSGVASSVNSIYVNRMGNENLRWEKTTSYNAGLDFSVLHDRISGSIDLYKKKTSDLLVLQSLSDYVGFANVNSNLAKVNNKGFELTLNSKNITEGNIIWNSSFNFSLNRNEIVSLATKNDDTGNGWFYGKDIDVIWDYKILGVWQENEVEEANKFNKAIKPGDFKLQDVDNNYVYNDADKQFLGYKNPRFTWALRNDFNIFKNFDFAFQLLSNWGQKKKFNLAENQPGSVGFGRSSSYVMPYWTPDNPINDYARLNSGLSGTSINVWRDNSFIRLNTVSLGYNIPKTLVNKVRVQSAKVYVNVTNAAYYAPTWNYWDPQNDGPTPRYCSLGINVSL